MKLKAFRIRNYKSILDSGMCYVNSNLTIFAGKNESGKTNILTAMQHLSIDNKFNTNDYPLRKTEYSPSIEYHFELDKKDCEFLNTNLGGLISKYHISCNDFSFILNSDKLISLCDGNILKVLQEKMNKDLNARLAILTKQIHRMGVDKEFSSVLDVRNFRAVTTQIASDRTAEINDLIDKFLQEVCEYPGNREREIEKGLLPKIIYFNSFRDNIPDVITKDCLNPTNEHYTIVSRLFKYLNIDKDKIFRDIKTEEEDVIRRDYLKSLEKSISDDIFEKYKQKPIKLGFAMSSSSGGLRIDVYDTDENGNIPQGDLPYKISDRSEGFRWFLSFYITLKGENFTDNDIILIDEPGLYLHASAQRDMLNVFLEESEKHQIIFTTHSPYLIDINNLARIRLVEKKKKKLNDNNIEETKIISSIIKGSDNETLTPIADAIGYSLNEGLNIDLSGMAVVEGPSDYFYITKMASILNESLKVNIIPAGGASKISNICAILIGFGVKNIVCLYDNDEAGNNAIKQNMENLGFSNIKHMLVSQNKNYQIEDLFSIEDFSKHISEKDNPAKTRNSKLVEKSDKKTLLSKMFSEKKLSKGDFNAETIENFTKLIKMINNEK